jgi:flagellar transcriptional activator FlhC
MATCAMLIPPVDEVFMSQHTHHFRSLDIARAALELGARRSVIRQFTGLSESELHRVFGTSPALTMHRGGRPSSVEKLFHRRETHLHASDFYNGFHHLLHRGVAPDEALVVAYRHYQARHRHDARLDFDRAFSVVTAVCRLWTTAPPSLTTMRCGTCHAQFLAALDALPSQKSRCTYCKADEGFKKAGPAPAKTAKQPRSTVTHDSRALRASLALCTWLSAPANPM